MHLKVGWSFPAEGDLAAIGKRIVLLRRRRRWTQTELALRLGVKRERLGNWERGENAPALDGLIALAAAFRVSLDELVLGERRGRYLTAEEVKAAERHLAALSGLLG